jgi:hypothetical protein
LFFFNALAVGNRFALCEAEGRKDKWINNTASLSSRKELTEMFIRRLYIVIGLVLALGFFFGIVAYAQDTTQVMTIRFSAPVQIPGGTLPAGTYQFKPEESADGIVRVFDADETRLCATLRTIAAERSVTDEDLVVTVPAAESGKPNFLVEWFYPGRLVGRELVYSAEQEQQIAEATSRTSVGIQVPDGTPVSGN